LFRMTVGEGGRERYRDRVLTANARRSIPRA